MSVHVRSGVCTVSLEVSAHAPTAQRIWGTDEDGRTWRYMYFLTRPVSVYRRTDELASMGYLNQKYFGFTLINEEKAGRVLQDFGSFERFVRSALMTDSERLGAMAEIDAARIERRMKDEGEFDANSVEDARERELRAIVRRRGQARFRNALLHAYGGRCAVTGCDFEPALEAAHIIPYAGEGTNHVQNGLLLRSDIHTLFDLGELGIDPDSCTLLLSGQLAASDDGYLAGQQIRPPDDE